MDGKPIGPWQHEIWHEFSKGLGEIELTMCAATRRTQAHGMRPWRAPALPTDAPR